MRWICRSHYSVVFFFLIYFFDQSLSLTLTLSRFLWFCLAISTIFFSRVLLAPVLSTPLDGFILIWCVFFFFFAWSGLCVILEQRLVDCAFTPFLHFMVSWCLSILLDFFPSSQSFIGVIHYAVLLVKLQVCFIACNRSSQEETFFLLHLYLFLLEISSVVPYFELIFFSCDARHQAGDPPIWVSSADRCLRGLLFFFRVLYCGYLLFFRIVAFIFSLSHWKLFTCTFHDLVRILLRFLAY